MRVLLAGGGTAGHTSPLLATADALRRIDPSVEITCLGTERGLENTVIPAAGYRLELIPPVPLPRKPCVDINPASVTKLADRGSSQARGIVTDVGLFIEQLALELAPSFSRAR